MVPCRRCGKPNRETASRCEACGFRLKARRRVDDDEASTRCLQCGVPIPADKTRCINCGGRR